MVRNDHGRTFVRKGQLVLDKGSIELVLSPGMPWHEAADVAARLAIANGLMVGHFLAGADHVGPGVPAKLVVRP